MTKYFRHKICKIQKIFYITLIKYNPNDWDDYLMKNNWHFVCIYQKYFVTLQCQT